MKTIDAMKRIIELTYCLDNGRICDIAKEVIKREEAHTVDPITLNLAQCVQLVEMFGGDSETEITLLIGTGHSGKGCYAYYDEIPEEGAELLDPLFTHPAQVTERGEVVVTFTQDGQIQAVTRQDEEGRILSVIAESKVA